MDGIANSQGKPIAVLIDTEKVDADDARDIIAQLSSRFAPMILHGFGNFRPSRMRKWCEILDAHGGQALQVTSFEGFSNAIEICITMNAMEILHRRDASAICIFCGDSDFSQLAVRIRSGGLPVVGFGSAKHGRIMRLWFDSWHVLGEGSSAFDRPPGSLVEAEISCEEDIGEQPDVKPDPVNHVPAPDKKNVDFEAMRAIEGGVAATIAAENLR